MAKGLEKVLDIGKKIVAGTVIGSMLLAAAPKISLGEWEKTETYRTDETATGKREGVCLKYNIDINNPALSPDKNKLLIPVKKLKFNGIYEQYEKVTLNELREYEYKTVEIKPASDYSTATSLLLISFALASNKDTRDAGGIMLLLAILAAPKPSETTTKISKKYTGKVKEEIVSVQKLERLVSEERIFSDMPAQEVDVSVGFSSDDLRKYFGNYFPKTDYEGNLAIVVTNLPKKYDIKNWIFYSEEVKQNRLVQQIKPFVRDSLMSKIMVESYKGNIGDITLETKDADNDISIINDKKIISLKTSGVKEIPDKMIYHAVKNFVKEEINSNIRQISLRQRDIYSRDILNDSKFEIMNSPPGPRDLLSTYFEGELLDYAARYVTNYPVKGDILHARDDGYANFNVYLPFTYGIDAICPKYNFKEFQIDFSKPLNKNDIEYSTDSFKGAVFMLDVGDKIRTKPVIK